MSLLSSDKSILDKLKDSDLNFWNIKHKIRQYIVKNYSNIVLDKEEIQEIIYNKFLYTNPVSNDIKQLKHQVYKLVNKKKENKIEKDDNISNLSSSLDIIEPLKIIFEARQKWEIRIHI